jgi:hypothetical protein
MGNYTAQVKDVIDSYAAHFGPPAETLPFRVGEVASHDLAIVLYLPEDPESTTQLGTAGLSVMAIGDDFRAEIGIEVKNGVKENERRLMADALVALGTAPLKTGRLFSPNQVVGNVQIPLFERFNLAILLDWDPVYGFTFPNLREPVTLLRLVPIFESEARFIESQPDRARAYVRLYGQGLVPEDYARQPVV